MPRVREITEEDDDPVLRDVFGKEREAFGDLLNPTRVMAHCPPIMLAAKRLSAAVEKSNLLPAQMRALVYLRVATLNGCPF
jgi:alkylhydroperoxidase family enzyme